MEKQLRKYLNQSDDVDFRELGHALQIADLCRQCLRTYNLTIEQFSERLGYTVEETKEIITGAFPFDLRSISKIDALRQALHAEASERAVEPIIKFPEYRDSNKSEASTNAKV